MIGTGFQHISSGQRLQLTLAESFIRSGMYEKAKEVLLNLARVYGTIHDPDALAKRGMFRVWVSLARITHMKCHWDQALLKGNKASDVLKTLEQQDSPHFGLVQGAIAHALFKLRKMRESLDVLAKARDLLNSDVRRYWIVGVDSYWRDYIIECVDRTVGA